MNWASIIKEESKKDYFKDLVSKIEADEKEHKVYPPKKDRFNAFKLCLFEQTKVVLLGQDPYHGEGQAHGLSFSVPEGVKIPPSLQNIYKELKSDLGIEPAPHGCLYDWAKQGVLLLNSGLTVKEKEPGSHKNFGWEKFTEAIMHHLNQIDRPIVFMLWGAHAKNQMQFLDERENQLILSSAHPSPFSAANGFFGSKPFSKANDFLVKHGLDPIDWRLQC